MMTGMMETFKNDTLMMSSMSSIMLKNPQMKDQIYKNRNGNMGVDFRKYKILGACNPAYAYKEIQQEDKIEKRSN